MKNLLFSLLLLGTAACGKHQDGPQSDQETPVAKSFACAFKESQSALRCTGSAFSRRCAVEVLNTFDCIEAAGEVCLATTNEAGQVIGSNCTEFNIETLSQGAQ